MGTCRRVRLANAAASLLQNDSCAAAPTQCVGDRRLRGRAALPGGRAQTMIRYYKTEQRQITQRNLVISLAGRWFCITWAAA